MDFDELYKAAEAMGAKPVEIDLNIFDEKISAGCITVDFGRKNRIAAAQEKHTQNKST